MKRIRGTSSIDEGTPIMSHWIKIEHVYLYIPNRSVGGSTFQKVNRTYFDPFYEPPPRGKVWSLQSFHAVRRRHVWSFTGFWRALGIRELPKIKPCPSLCCSATSCTCCSCSLLKILTTVARMHKKKKSSCNFGFSTHDSFRKKNMLLFRKQLSCLLGHSWTSKKKSNASGTSISHHPPTAWGGTHSSASHGSGGGELPWAAKPRKFATFCQAGLLLRAVFTPKPCTFRAFLLHRCQGVLFL